tara:strand:- start:434 stop:1177 length:744 start_codon:yes stop_codon:yes gene_type:complete
MEAESSTLEGFLLGLDNETPLEAARESLAEYVKDMTPEEVRDGLPLSRNWYETEWKLHHIVDRLKLQYPIFQAATGITALEQITLRGEGDIKGYQSLAGLAAFLSGKTCTKAQAREYFRELAKENKMPILTKVHQNYVDEFSIKYIMKTGTNKLKDEIPIGKNTIFENDPRYSHFLHELSKKISQNREMQYEFFKKWTGITALEQITPKGEGDIKGYESLTGLAAFLSGEKKKQAQAGEYFRSFFPK